MPIIHISTVDELSNTFRLDAEYFLPERIHSSEILDNMSSKSTINVESEWVTQGPNPKFSEEGIICLNGRNVYFGTAIEGDTNFITPGTFTSLKRFALQPGDIVITLKHATKIGRAWINSSPEPQLFSRNVGLIRLKKRSSVNSASLLFFLWSKDAQNVLDRIATGGTSGQITLPISSLKQMQVPVFSQKFELLLDRIFNSYVELNHLSRIKYEHAEKMLLAEINLLDYHFDNRFYFSNSYCDVFREERIDADHFQPKYEDLRRKIREYEGGYIKLTDIADISKEKITSEDKLPTDTDYIELSCVDSNIGVIKDTIKICGKERPSRARMILRKGDVIASSIKGSLNKVGLINSKHNNSIGSTGFFVFKPKNVESEFLLTLIKNIIVSKQMRCEASGTILAAVNSRKLNNVIVPNVTESIQNKISKLIQCSHNSHWKGLELIQNAKKSVDIALESGESNAIRLLERIIQ